MHPKQIYGSVKLIRNADWYHFARILKCNNSIRMRQIIILLWPFREHSMECVNWSLIGLFQFWHNLSHLFSHGLSLISFNPMAYISEACPILILWLQIYYSVFWPYLTFGEEGGGNSAWTRNVQHLLNGSRYCKEILQVYFYIIRDCFACFQIFYCLHTLPWQPFFSTCHWIEKWTKSCGFHDFSQIALKFGGG